MKKTLCYVLPAMIVGLSLTACVDDKYDLSDIDTTVEVKVVDLTIPANLDEIYLKNMLNPDGTDITVVNGEYCVNQSGEFHSDDIFFDPILLNAPNLETQRTGVDATGLDRLLAALGKAEVPLPGAAAVFSYDDDNISHDIESIDAAGVEMSIDITLEFEGLDALVKNLTFKDVVLQYPKGLTMIPAKTDGEYDPATGIVHVDTRRVQGAALKLHAAISKVDSRAGYRFSPGSIHFSDRLSIVSGTVEVDAADVTDPSKLPQQLDFAAKFVMSDINLTSFSGKIKYTIEDVDIPRIDLSILPDLLNQEGTNIILSNPQIYLDLNNPVGRYNLLASTGVSITPYRGDEAGVPISTAAGAVSIPATTNPGEMIAFCLSPQKPTNMLLDFANAKWVEYPRLGYLLSGNGMPTSLKVDLLEPGIGNQPVVDFPIGKNVGKIDGHYTFFTPLQLAVGSTIVYADDVTGWWSDDLDKLTITGLHVRALVSTDAPLSVAFTGYPLDRDGNRMQGVSIEGANIPAGAKDYPVDIYITGNVTGLDGIRFVATATADSSEALSENMFIRLSQIKATVSGFYRDEL